MYNFEMKIKNSGFSCRYMEESFIGTSRTGRDGTRDGTGLDFFIPKLNGIRPVPSRYKRDGTGWRLSRPVGNTNLSTLLSILIFSNAFKIKASIEQSPAQSYLHWPL
jgi:hypothetical protein